MNERSIFLEALDKDDPSQRSAFLDAACAGDEALRRRIEALLKSHAEAGNFLGKLAPQRVAEALGGPPTGDATPAETPGDSLAAEDLGFLAPSDRPGVLGRLGHYEVHEVVGRGGMGVVLRAFDGKLHRVVAIKVMAAQLASNATARKRFTREAQAAAAVSHDHVVTIHAVEADGPRPYLVMPYVAGLSLQQRLDRDGPLELHEILRIGMQTAAGLAAAHAQGLVHRDVKPSNILLENGVERVKLTDFGLARAADDASQTQSGAVAGTPQYMSPEQAEGEAVDQRSDLFSLGSVLYAMCTGRAPFRAKGSMAVLKRVCEETATPIREVNPNIPEWLAAVVDKLHAKDPARRYQSAAEVADLLGRYLAHLQHPSAAPLPAAEKPAGEKAAALPRPRARRWAVAAALPLCLIAGLGLAEAAGVTKLAATVVRILTPEGTLVVETNDPAVKVTVEGDGDLVITGAGAQEVRLRPGSYRVRATKDGKPVALDRDLVSITRGDKQVVRVRLESGAPAAAAPKREPGAFAVLGGRGVAERKFDTLAEAVVAAADGDVIEVRGNGPFISQSVDIGTVMLTIRAGRGFKPVIKLSLEGGRPFRGLIATRARLVLEGLELHGRGSRNPKVLFDIVHSERAPVSAANCRFVLAGGNPWASVLGDRSPLVQVRNCEFLRAARQLFAQPDVAWVCPPRGRLIMQNCVGAGGVGAHFSPNAYGKDADVSFRLTANTLVTDLQSVYLGFVGLPEFAKAAAKPREKPVRVNTSTNIFVTGTVLEFSQYDVDHPGRPEPLPPGQMKDLFARLCDWAGQRDLYSVREGFAMWSFGARQTGGLESLAAWNRALGGAQTGSLEGRVRFQGGSLLAMMRGAPEQLTPEDFRLRADSAGYRAGKAREDLGADVDLVGPGKAYEKWKATPDYQQWLKDTGQKE